LNTKGKWGLRIEDVLADALELGPLRDRDFDLPEPLIRRLVALTPDGVPPEATILLCKYYLAYRPRRPEGIVPDWMTAWQAIRPPSEDDANPFVVLPEQNFNAFFGTTAFSQKWIYALTGPILERKTCDGVCKYRINKALLGEGGPDRE
jgi:hypothetical protein